MGIQVFFLGLLCFAWSARAAGDQVGDCFDFAREIKEPPVHQKAVRFPPDAQKLSGELPSGVVWAAVKDRSPRSLTWILDDLASHMSNKSHRIREMEISELGDKNFLRHQK